MTTRKRLSRVLHIVLATGVGCAAQAPVAPSPNAVWTSAPSMLHARAAHAVAATDDAIFALAGSGSDNGAPVLEIERFDGVAWRDVARLPGQGLNAPAAVTLSGKVYLVGGFRTITNAPTSDVHVFDPNSNEWSKAPDLPAARGGHAAAILDGRIHIVGGGNSRSTLADHSVLDIATNTWVARAPLPRALGSPAAVVHNGTLYVIGGRSGPRDFGDVMIYDEKADSWSNGPSIEPRATCGAASIHGSIYVFGGESQAQARVLADVLRLRGHATAWETASPMPTARNFARAVIFRDALYVIGGSTVPQTSHAPIGTAVVERMQLKPR
ncbi:MAG: Kelch repeat-containing protein [Phycisphaerales bacterium]